MQIDWIWLSITLPIPHVSSWGELPAFWMIMGGLTVLYAEIERIATSSARSCQRLPQLGVAFVLFGLTWMVVFWPVFVVWITKDWIVRRRERLRHSPQWDWEQYEWRW